MQVFAPSPFRYQGVDYPYGWQDVAQSLGDVLVLGKYVTTDGSEARESINSVVFDSAGNISDPASLAAVRKATSLASRVGASVARARISNSYDATPWFKPPTWQQNGTYRQGMTVASTDGVNRFLCRYSVGNANGQSAASGSGPTGTPYTWVADNQLVWEWVGPIMGQDTNANLQSLLTINTSSVILGQFSHPVTVNPGLTNPIGTFAGGTLVAGSAVGSNNGPRVMVASDATGQMVADSQSATFTVWTDADLIGGHAGQQLDPGGLMALIEVNDIPLTHGFTLNQLTFYSFAAWSLNLSYWGKGRFKKLRIRTTQARPLYYFLNGLTVEAGCSLWVEPTPSWSMAIEGDSLTGGGNGVPWCPNTNWTEIAAAKLGCENYVNNAIGGTGIASNGVSFTTAQQRIGGMFAINPDVFVVSGNHNDQQYPQSQQINAAMSYFAALRSGAKSKASPIIVLGNNWLRGEAHGPGSPVYLAEQNLATACASMNDPYLTFVPNLTSNNPVFTGSGTADSPAYDGNADRVFSNQTGIAASNPDGHPILRGYTLIGLRNAKAIEAVLAA